MASINKVILMGNVANVKFFEFAKHRFGVQLDIATNNYVRRHDGEFLETTTFHKCVISIQSIVLHIRENGVNVGDIVCVEGCMIERSYINKDGVKVKYTEVPCDRYQKVANVKKGEKHVIEETKRERPHEVDNNDKYKDYNF